MRAAVVGLAALASVGCGLMPPPVPRESNADIERKLKEWTAFAENMADNTILCTGPMREILTAQELKGAPDAPVAPPKNITIPDGLLKQRARYMGCNMLVPHGDALRMLDKNDRIVSGSARYNFPIQSNAAFFTVQLSQGKPVRYTVYSSYPNDMCRADYEMSDLGTLQMKYVAAWRVGTSAEETYPSFVALRKSGLQCAPILEGFDFALSHPDFGRMLKTRLILTGPTVET